MSRPKNLVPVSLSLLLASLVIVIGHPATALGQKRSHLNHRLSYYYFNEKIELPLAANWLSAKLKANDATAPLGKFRRAPTLDAMSSILAELDLQIEMQESRGFVLLRLPEAGEPTTIANKLLSSQVFEFIGPVLQYGHVRMMVTNEFIIRVPHDSDVFRIAKEYGAIAVRRLDARTFALRLEPSNPSNGLEIANKIFEAGLVEFAQPNFIYPSADLLCGSPNDPEFEKQWALRNTGQRITIGDVDGDHESDYVRGVAGADLSAELAWQITKGSPSIKIAIMDSGIEFAHPDLTANVLPGFDAIDEDSVANDDDESGYGGHGTAAAGIAAAIIDNGIGISGVAPHCKLLPIRIFDEAATDDASIYAGFQAAVRLHADVIVNAWVGGSPSAAITEAIRQARTEGREGRGCVVVFSTGNDGKGVIPYPASLPEVIAVGASNMFDERKSSGSRDELLWWGSNYGDEIDVVAPGIVYTTDLTGSGGFDEGDYCPVFSGTSAASPHVGGVAALLLSLNPALSATEVQDLLEASCDRIGTYSYEVRANGLWCAQVGYGRVSAYRALKLAQGEDAVPPQILPHAISSARPDSPIRLSATIQDANGVTFQKPVVATDGKLVAGKPILYYRVADGRDFSSWLSAFDEDGPEGNLFRFTLPSQPNGTAVQYFFWATDASSNGNIATCPFNDEFSGEPGSVALNSVTTFVGELAPGSMQASNDVPVTIPYQKSLVSSTLTVTSNFRIADVNAHVDIRHSFDSDLILILESPQGARVTLSSRNGDSSDDYRDTIFDDEADKSVTKGKGPFHDSYRPEEALSEFDGELAAGVWKLIIIDKFEVDSGELRSWGLVFSHAGEPQVSVENHADDQPLKFELRESYPNPFDIGQSRTKARIGFTLPQEFSGKAVLRIYNLLGEVVHESRPTLRPGVHVLEWDGRDRLGRAVASGVYFYSLHAGQHFGTRKMVVVR